RTGIEPAGAATPLIDLPDLAAKASSAQYDRWHADLSALMRQLADTPLLRLAAAHRACEQLQTHVQQLESTLEAELQAVQRELGRAQVDTPEPSTSSRWLSRSKPEPASHGLTEDQIADYVRLLIHRSLVEGAGRFVRQARHDLSVLSDQLTT